jgi:hypothetical protein
MDAPRRVTDSSWFAAGAATLFLVLSVGIVWFARAIAGVEDGLYSRRLSWCPPCFTLYFAEVSLNSELREDGWLHSYA